MSQIWKYQLRPGTHDLAMPKGAAVLTVGVQRDKVVLWASVDATAPLVRRRFMSVPTGIEYEDEGAHHVGTVLIEHGLIVIHVFTDNRERPIDDPAQMPERCSYYRPGTPGCEHAFTWSDEVKTTAPLHRVRSCQKCPLSECIAVCGPKSDRINPCGLQDCPTCGWGR